MISGKKREKKKKRVIESRRSHKAGAQKLQETRELPPSEPGFEKCHRIVRGA